VLLKYKEIIVNFIWDGKPPKVKYKAIINDIPNGGLKLQDLETKVKALQLKWVQNLNNINYTAAWKEYVATKFKNSPNKETIVEYNMQQTDYPWYNDKFYNSLFETWAKLHNRPPTTGEQVLRETIWNNSYIRADNKTFYYKNWVQKGITFIKDLINQRGQIMDKQEFLAHTGIKLRPLQYESAISAIPKQWKKLVKEGGLRNNDYLVFAECKVKINDMTRQLNDIKTKDIYWHLLADIMERPTSEDKWREKTDLELTEEEFATIYTVNQHLTRDTSIINFQYKITHRLLACGNNLKIWRIKESNLCEICKQTDTIEHFLIQCEPVSEFWTHVLNWWKSSIKVIFRIETYELLFGIPNDEKDSIISQFNFVLLMGRYYIYKSKKAGTKLDVYLFLIECKNHLSMEYNIMTANNESEKFQKNWSDIFENL
jgi:hypothetical protein